jgi:hypothetical protein
VCKETFTKHEHSLFTPFISKNDYDKYKMILYNVKSKNIELKKMKINKTKIKKLKHETNILNK